MSYKLEYRPIGFGPDPDTGHGKRSPARRLVCSPICANSPARLGIFSLKTICSTRLWTAAGGLSLSPRKLPVGLMRNSLNKP